MKFEDVKKFIEENKDNEEVKAYLEGLNPLDVSRVQKLVEEDKEMKKWLDSVKDKHLAKGLETWKSNNLEKLIDEEIKKRFPEKDEKEIELEKVKAELEKIKQDAIRKELTNKAIKIANEKKLPLNLVDYFIADDEEKTTKNLETLESVFTKHVETLVNERLEQGNYTPPKGGSEENVQLAETFRKALG